MRLTKKTQNVMDCAVRLAQEHHHRYFMPEHMIYGITFDEDFCREYQAGGGNVEKLRQDIWNFLKEQAGTSEAQEGQQTTLDAQEVFEMAELQAHSSGRDAIEVSHLLSSILELSESYGVYYMKVQDVDLVEVLGEMSRESLSRERGEELGKRTPEPAYGEDTPEGAREERYKDFLENMSETCKKQNPLIGREEELERTIQILCRKDKNNVLHIGEPGVGKTLWHMDWRRGY